jgi:hypothetical protein
MEKSEDGGREQEQERGREGGKERRGEERERREQ